MSTSTTELMPKTSSLFLGLQSYSEAQSDIFYGRKEETDHLTNLVNSNTLTIVFGKSGTGKTSLLNAGVFPRLRKEYFLPFRIRLEFNEDSPELVSQIRAILRSEIDKYGFKVASYPASETLWEYFHSEPLWKSVTPILVFDQFEEIFTLAKRNERFSGKELENFWEELADLIENSIPEKLKKQFLDDKENIGYNYKEQKVKILFSFREEFLPEFEGITTKIPSIKYSRFRLLPMNGNQAYDVITKTWKDRIDEAQVNKIISFFNSESEKKKSLDILEVEPSLLSQVCAYIDKERISEGSEKISAEFLDRFPKETILRSIYNEALSESNSAIHENEKDLREAERPVNEFLEDKLITDEGHRIKHYLTEQEENLKPGIDVLRKKYFLRGDEKSVELSHDVLTPIIKSDREERRKEIAVAAAKQKARKRAAKIITAALLISAVVAGLIWFFITKKARKDKEIAEKETIIIREKIVKDSIKLDSVKKRIDLLVVDKDNPDELLALQKQIIESDSIIKMLNEKINLLAAENIDSDSIKNDLQKSREALAQAKFQDSTAAVKVYNELNEKYIDLNNTYTALKSTNVSSKTEYTTLKNNFDDLKRDYDLLERNFDKYKESQVVTAAPAKTPPPLDNNRLKLNLYSSKNQNIPHNLVIFLIPDVSANQKLIRSLKTHDNRYDFASLRSAEGAKTAVYGDEGYAFPDVAPGDYFIKICANYGPYQSVTKKAVGVETAPKLDYSEIVR